MFGQRRQVDIAFIQKKMKNTFFEAFNELDITELDKVFEIKQVIIDDLKKIELVVKGKREENYFKGYSYLTKSIFHLLYWASNEISGEDDANKHKKAASNKALIAQRIFNKIEERPSIKKMNEIIRDIFGCDDIFGVVNIAKCFCNIPLMVVYRIFHDPFENRKGYQNNQDENEIQEVSIISALFYIDDVLWANPQILQPNINYTISGEIKLNNWEKGFKLILSPVSTTDDSWYILSIPQIIEAEKNTIRIQGNILFKYTQNFQDKPLSIKLFCTIKKNDNRKIHPTLIGYDQLKARVLDKSVFPYPTKYNKLNEKLFEIYKDLIKLPKLSKEELNDFLIILSRILNYQGYCNEHSIYKKLSKLLEDRFRDELIQYLSVSLGEEIYKEPHLAGGRVEILFRGIPVELKVEKSLSDREKLKKKYGQQSLTYASARLKYLSILCILDLTSKKKIPQNLASENIFVIKPKFHGFNDENYKTNSRVIMIVIDGNTENPSNYSKTIN